MTVKEKRLPIYFSEDALSVLSIIQDSHGENDLSLSGAVNLAAQLAAIVATAPLPLTAGELLYCCDVLNGGASLTEVKTPDAVSIRQALEGMTWSLADGIQEPGLCDKWGIDGEDFIQNLEGMTEPQLFALAFATRQFWSGKPFGTIKPLAECDGYQAWANQWCVVGA